MLKNEDVIGFYRCEKKVTAESTADLTVVGDEVPRGTMLKVTQQAIIDYTTTGKSLLLGRRDAHDKDHYYSAERLFAHASAETKGQPLLLEGEAPIGLVVGASKDDEIYFTTHGILYRI